MATARLPLLPEAAARLLPPVPPGPLRRLPATVARRPLLLLGAAAVTGPRRGFARRRRLVSRSTDLPLPERPPEGPGRVMATRVRRRSGTVRACHPPITRVCAGDGRRVLLSTRGRLLLLSGRLVPQRPPLGVRRPGVDPFGATNACRATRRVRTPRCGPIECQTTKQAGALKPVLKAGVGPRKPS